MNNVSFLKGVGIGIMVGGAIGATAIGQKKSSRGTIGRALKNLGNLVEDVTDVITK